jgi:nicotinate dehydrogenase subunit B
MIANALPKGLTDNPELARWVGFEETGRVRVGTGKVELGQGILTALAQIAAEELDVSMDRLSMVSGNTVSGPAEDFTSGSNSTAASGSAVRLACAEVRALFLERAAERLGCPAEELSIVDGHIHRAGAETGIDYWSLAGEVDLKRPPTGRVSPKPHGEYRIVGRSWPRIDLAGKITGAVFIHDLAPEGMLHARVLHRPWRGARLVRLDEDALLRRAKGTVDIVRDGDFAAFVSRDEVAVMRAHEAARGLAVWEGGDPVPDDIDGADRLRGSPARTRRIGDEPAEAGDAGIVEAEFRRPFLAHGSIAPSCALAHLAGGRLTVHTHSQGVFVLRTWLSRILAFDIERIDVIHRHGAGCYGHNSADDAAFEAAFLALRFPGSPVRVQWAREDEFTASPLGPAGLVKLRAHVEDGRPADWTMEIWSPVHAGRPGMNGSCNFLAADALSDPPARNSQEDDIPDAIGGGATRNAAAYYDLPRHRIVHHQLSDVPLRTSTLRALGSYLNVFAIECFLDELAGRAGLDPVDYRLAMTGDPRARKVIKAAAAMAGWPGPDPGEGQALGLGFGRYKNNAAYMAAVAEVEVAEEVRVRHVWCAVDAGLVVNPDGAANQIEGGVVQATSWALKERIRFEDGRVVSDSWETYPILRFSEVPGIEISFIEAPGQPTLGIGEASVGPTAAAIGNAVSRALGARIRELPMSRERIMEALLA